MDSANITPSPTLISRMMNLRPLVCSALALLTLPALAAPIKTGLEAEAEATVPDTTMLTPELFQACEQGDTERVRNLLRKGAEVNVRNMSNYTPVGIAIKNGHTDIVQMLIRHGACTRLAAHYSDFPDRGEGLSDVIFQELALLPLRKILTDGVIGNRCEYHDVYTVEELRNYKQCYPQDYARYLAELSQSRENVALVVEACRDWLHKTGLFAETYYAKELDPQTGLWNRSDNVRTALRYAIRQDAKHFAGHACWYTSPVGELGPDTTSPQLYDFVPPSNAPAQVRTLLGPMQEYALGKHSSSDLIISAHKLWRDIQNQEIATLRQELLHDAEVQRLFDESIAAWSRYHELMLSLHISRCRCTNGTENHELGIWMLSHRAFVLDAIRYMSKKLLSESEYLRGIEARASEGS